MYLWQGGFDPVAGIIAAAVVLAVGLPSLRKGAASMLVLGAATGLWIGYLQLEAQRPRPPFPEGIRLADLDGRPVSLDDLRGRPFVVNLWASWCGPCRREMPMFVEVASTTPDVQVVLVNQGEEPRLIQRFLEEEGLPARNVLSDRAGSLMRTTGSSGLPTTLFVRPDGLVEGPVWESCPEPRYCRESMSCLRSSRSSHPGREAWTKPLSVLGPKAPEADVPLRPVLESTWRVRYAPISAVPALNSGARKRPLSRMCQSMVQKPRGSHARDKLTTWTCAEEQGCEAIDCRQVVIIYH
jgi:thiol-disulfide isomerase/thioredoxin